jgi:hypothetical protein
MLHSFISPTAIFVATATAFAPAARQNAFVVKPLSASTTLPGAEVDDAGNNVAVRDLLVNIEQSGLLTQVAQSGLLSKAQAAGISLSKLEPLLALASENPDILILVEASGPELLPLLPKLIELAPPALPLLAFLISIPPAVIQTLGLASLAAAVGTVVVVPDDTVLDVAVQTLAVGVFGAAAAASFVGASVIGTITK